MNDVDETLKNLKAELDFPNDLEDIGCSTCKSPFHEDKDCPQTKTGESKFQFRTRKEMGLEPGSLPFKFRVEIEEGDDEVEVTRKRALLRLNSNKVYNLMGLSIKAHESQKQALQWLIRLADELDIDDKAMQEERNQLLPLIQTLQESMIELKSVRAMKIKQAEAMEEEGTKARKAARRVRKRLSNKKQQSTEFYILRLPDSGVDIPITYDETRTPTEMFKDVADSILKKEKLKLPEEPEDSEE